MTAKECPACGRREIRRPDGSPHQPHHLGCRNARRAQSARVVTRESECLKDGCTEPRAESRGPRPAKFCEEHKTGKRST